MKEFNWDLEKTENNPQIVHYSYKYFSSSMFRNPTFKL